MSADSTPLAPGLYLVATPIGNLGDITLRALDVLRGVDRIACEDTRQTQKLLNHFQIAKPTVSYHEHNERSRSGELIQEIKRGSAIAVVTDAGTPAVSDPGGWLVREAIAAGVPVIPIPGANAAVSAFIASGLPGEEFHFVGFLPQKAGARRTFLEDLAAAARLDPRETPRTLIFYEAPHRILESLSDIEELWGSRLHAVLARELTKVYEEFVRGTVAEIRAQLGSRDRIRGEITLLVEAPRAASLSSATKDSAAAPERLGNFEQELEEKERIADRFVPRIEETIDRMKTAKGIDEKEALKRLAKELGRSKSDLYRELQRRRARKR